MSEKLPEIDGRLVKRTDSEKEYTREFEENFGLVKFNGNIHDLPEEFKRNLTVDKAERFESGDMLMLMDDHVSKFNSEMVELYIEQHDFRSKMTIDREALNDDVFYCPFCGDQMRMNQRDTVHVRCSDCMTGGNVYAMGDEMVFELGP